MNRFILALLSALSLGITHAQDLISTTPAADNFPIVSANTGTAPILTDLHDHWLVHRSVDLFGDDIQQITGSRPTVMSGPPADALSYAIIVGSMDSSPLIQQLIKTRALPAEMQGKWENYLIRTIERPFPNIGHALVIAGSDRRGTAYALFELSRQMGVSPWYYWADVPIQKKPALFVSNKGLRSDGPAVKYRGFFINDEAPALSGWVHEKFGNFNHYFYEKVFELLLRLKANYLWPAMWGNAFNDDDTLNPILASQYGIVMGTSHHEPMMRAQQEWKRYGAGPWDYTTNAHTLDSFWRIGIQHMDHHESIVTIGMRGDGDKPMLPDGSNKANVGPSAGPPTSAVALLEKIVGDQRRIIADVTKKPATATPQSWALYKEVQDYYDKGMRVPDDVTLLLCDDNWGNIRKLPRPGDKPRAGGYGLYYHFDYVGGPRNYKWINTNQISRVWEQLHLAKTYGVDRIWIVNVGDIKPLEFPTQFFLDYAWDPNAIPAAGLPTYTYHWAAEQFGTSHASAIADILEKYTKYNARRKPELLSPDTYSLTSHREWETVTAEYKSLAGKTQTLGRQLPAEYQDAYYELVAYPVLASANLYQLYYTVARNHYYAKQGSAMTNELATQAAAFYAKDSTLALTYNRDIAGGKWHHMMDQTHIGYTSWQEPRHNIPPHTDTIDLAAATGPTLGVDTTSAAIPVTIRPDYPTPHPPASFKGFIETDGCLAIEAEHFSTAVSSPSISWLTIPELGRTLSGVEAEPTTSPTQIPGKNTPHLEYKVWLTDTGTVKVQAYCSPIIAFNGKPIHYAIGFDDEKPRLIDLTTGNEARGTWDNMVADNIKIAVSTHTIYQPGPHTLNFYMVDPGVVLQRLVIDAGGVKPSYLGPPESPRPGASLASAYRDYFPIGVAVSARSISGPDSSLIIQQFNSLTPENAMKMGPIHPEQNRYNWRDADAIVAFAQRHGMRVRGHNLCWHEQTPSWLFKDEQGKEVSKDTLLRRLKDHITAVVSRYKGKIYAWDVVNEAVADDSTEFLRRSEWYRICGESFIAKAFEYAHAADPDAQLFYNDYNTERPEKLARVYKLMKQLVDAHVPITGIGLQGHWSIYEPSGKELQTAIDRFASLGLKVQITELDVSIYPWEKNRRLRRPDEQDAYTPELQQRQTDQYKMIFSVFRRNSAHAPANATIIHPVITGVTFWNVSDKHTWLDEYPVAGRKNYPLLFDIDNQPKKAFYQVIDF